MGSELAIVALTKLLNCAHGRAIGAKEHTLCWTHWPVLRQIVVCIDVRLVSYFLVLSMTVNGLEV